MTREQLMLNRILDKETVDAITEQYAADHMPDWHEGLSDGDRAEREYISPEKVQRMPPEEAADCLLRSGRKDYEARDTNGIIHILSAATGRTGQDLRDAIFGTGSFDAMSFYNPTDFQKRIIRFVFGNVPHLSDQGIKWADYAHWPERMKQEWQGLLAEKPSESWTENINEVNAYIAYYAKNGIPSWLY